MLAIPSEENSFNLQLIAFPLSQRGVHGWARWLEKFEALLRTLYWYEVRLHLITEAWGNYQYSWKPEGSWLNGSQPQPIQKWTFSGGPRSFA